MDQEKDHNANEEKKAVENAAEQNTSENTSAENENTENQESSQEENSQEEELSPADLVMQQLAARESQKAAESEEETKEESESKAEVTEVASSEETPAEVVAEEPSEESPSEEPQTAVEAVQETETPLAEESSEKAKEENSAEVPASDTASKKPEPEPIIDPDFNFEEADSATLISKSEELLQGVQGDDEVRFKEVDQALDKIRNVIQERSKKERAEAEEAYKAKNEGRLEGFDFVQPAFVDEFFDKYKAIKAEKQKYFASLTQQKQDNLAKKKALVNKLRSLIENGEQGKAGDSKDEFELVKSIREEFNAIGSVPQPDADDLYKNFRALQDRFYQNKTMERELRDLDRQKNLEAKLKICDKAEQLLEVENVNDAVRELNRLHQEYKQIGHVPRDKQEELWQRFKVTSDKIYDRKRAYADEFKEQLQDNMKLKQDLCLRAESYAVFQTDRIKEWNTKTNEIKALQKEWETVGPAPREVAKNLNRQFWANFKQFFQNKGVFFDKLEAEREENLKKKEVLLAKAEEIKESFDWKEAANELKGLQRQWKQIGPVPRAKSDEIFNKFKAACDHFFERSRNRKNEEEKEFLLNLEKKEEICTQVETLAKAEETPDIQAVEDLNIKWLEIGFVPNKKLNYIQSRFNDAIEAFFDRIGLDENERGKKRAMLQIKALKKSPKAAGKLKSETGSIKKRITSLENDINLWQNNLEFFASSKTADKLREEFNVKIENAQKEIDMLNGQLRALDKQAADEEKAVEEKSNA